MKILNTVQGSQSWLDLRAKHFTASEAAAMMGASKYQTRDQLLQQKATGESKEVSPHQQAIFDRGHATEAAARPIVEAMLSEELYPVVGTSDDHPHLLASFDGLTMMGDVIFEHKLYNAALAALVEKGDIPASHYWQLEQQLLVSGAEKVIFVVSDGTKENFAHCEYRPVAGRAEQLLAGWEQFATDLSTYVAPTASAKLDVLPVAELPAISYRLNGTQLTSNLIDFRKAAEQLVEDSLRPLETDQDFADAESLIKSFKAAEDNIKQACANVVGEIKDVDQFAKDLGYIGEQIRQARLNSEKAVKTRKIAIREEVVSTARSALAEFLRSIDPAVNGLMPRIDADFEGAIKGKRTLESLRGAVNDELARAKIEANQVAEKIRFNLSLLEIHAAEYRFLFNDLAQFVTKDADDFGALVQLRVTTHKQAEAAKLERQREQIRIEEERKAAAKAQADLAAANAETERQHQAEMAASHPDEEPVRGAPRFTVPTQRKPIEPAPVQFVGKECRTDLTGERERAALDSLFGRAAIDEMAYDDEGNEYALEVTVHRVRIINTQAA